MDVICVTKIKKCIVLHQMTSVGSNMSNRENNGELTRSVQGCSQSQFLRQTDKQGWFYDGAKLVQNTIWSTHYSPRHTTKCFTSVYLTCHREDYVY